MDGHSAHGVVRASEPGRWQRAAAITVKIALSTVVVAACAHHPSPVSPADCAAARADATHLAAAWQGQRLAGVVEITARDGLLRHRVIATVATVPPDRLRIEVSDDLGQTQLLALVNGAALAFWTVRDGWRSGPPMLAALPLPAASWPHLPSLLLGIPCITSDCAPWYEDVGGTTVLLRCGNGTPEWQWDPRRQQVAGARLPPLRISYLDADTGNGLHPRDLDVDLGERRSLALRWQQFHFDRDFPSDLFSHIRRPETAPATDPSVERP